MEPEPEPGTDASVQRNVKDQCGAEPIFATRVSLLPTSAGLIPLPVVNLYWRPTRPGTIAGAAGATGNDVNSGGGVPALVAAASEVDAERSVRVDTSPPIHQPVQQRSR